LSELKRPAAAKPASGVTIRRNGAPKTARAATGAKAGPASAEPSKSADAAAKSSGRSSRNVPAGKKAGPVAMEAQRAVFLIGFTASGKSTVGRLLAIRMGNPFIDLEQEIAQRVGMAISMIVQRFGEEGYRTLETHMLERLFEPTSQGPAGPMVVATGEGIVESARNIEMMRKRGMICFLRASFEEVLRRLGTEVPLRPSFHDKDALLRNYELRGKLYSGSAHVALETDQRDPSQIVLELAQKLEEHRGSRSRSRSRRSRGA
jgi:shikimate kinase